MGENSTGLTTPGLDCRFSTNNCQLPGWRPFHTNLKVFSSQTDFQLTTNWEAPVVFNITPRYGPHKNNTVSIVVAQLLQLPNKGFHNTVSNSNSIVVEACLPGCCIAPAGVSLFSRSLPSNGSIRHNIMLQVLYCNKDFSEHTHRNSNA
jgi:hypothetical protein